MVRGLVYSLCAVIFTLLISMGWVVTGDENTDGAMVGGWTMLVSLFVVAPAAFGLGFWHHLKLNPKTAHWDAELGE